MDVTFCVFFRPICSMLAVPFVSFRRLRQTSSSAIQPGTTGAEQDPPTTSNLDESLPPRNQTLLKARLASQSKFVPSVGHTLEDWLSIPQEAANPSAILFNSVTLPFKWLLWTSKALAGLPPHQSLRERLCNQSASLGSVAGLFLVIAISAFFVPPTAHSDIDRILVDIYGILMFLSAMSLTVYVCLSLTVMYPLLESIPDFAALEAFKNLEKHWGGYELFLFNIGCQAVLVAMMVAAKVVYNLNVLYIVLALFAVLYSIAAFMTREFFIAIDPITTVHMGICNSADTLTRAAALAGALRDRHEDFMHGEENLKEHAATHYMDPDARRSVEHITLAGTNNENKGTRPQSRVVHTALGQHRVSVSTPIHTQTRTTDSATIDIDEVQNIEENEVTHSAGAPTKLSMHTVTLDDIFLAENRLLLTQAGSAMSAAECEHVYNILIKQGCRNTAHLVRLLRWAGEKSDKFPLSALQVCISLGIPAFHAIDIIDFISSLQQC